jgi:hypothetical protein
MIRGVNDTAVMCTAVSMTPLCKYDTAVTFDLIFDRLLKEISIEKSYKGKFFYTISITFTHKSMGVYYGSLLVTAVTEIGDFVLEFLREFEAIFKRGFKVWIKGFR